MKNTKERILTEAVKLFAQEGYEAVTVERIAAAVGIKAPSLYKHYKSKQAVFDAILREAERRDAAFAARCALPLETAAASPESYGDANIPDLLAFCELMFRHWTEDEFAAGFRRMLTVEQYRSRAANERYHQYLGTGPLDYTADLLGSRAAALALYAPMHLLYGAYDRAEDKAAVLEALRAHLEAWAGDYAAPVSYPLSEKYAAPALMARIMGPNPVKLEEELLRGHRIPAGATVCDLGSGQGLTSVFLAKEYGFRVYAADLWSEPEDNRRFFAEMGLRGEEITPVKADATELPFEKDFFDAVVSTDSYNYFGRDPGYLDRKLLPFVRPGGYIYIAVPGMKKDCHDRLPAALLLSWTPEQLDYLHDAAYWRSIVRQCEGAEVLTVAEMRSGEEVWADWLKQENPYAVGDRKAMEAGGGKYLNFIKIVLRKR